MNPTLAEKIADAILYEGYLLYPYRPSAIKNQQRFNFGVLSPQEYGLANGEPFSQQTECLVAGNVNATIQVQVRFLQLLAREKGTGVPWQEAMEQKVKAPEIQLRDLLSATQQTQFHYPGLNADDIRQQPLTGLVEIAAVQVSERLFKITVRTVNQTPLPVLETGVQIRRDDLLLHSLVSAHTILTVSGGEFISLLDPPEDLREVAASCQNVGTWPVLVGEEGQREMILSSPIILYDYPQIAPESAGDFFDGTEIDEMLTLRLMTLTDEEKRELSEGDDHARRILERTENLPAELLIKLHGAMRGLKPAESGKS